MALLHEGREKSLYVGLRILSILLRVLRVTKLTGKSPVRLLPSFSRRLPRKLPPQLQGL